MNVLTLRLISIKSKQLPGRKTITLHNFTGPLLDINLMGNGFTIKLEGENHLEMLRVWGYSYGGSVTLTGNGSLTINADRTNPIGIELQAEISQSCLMIDKEVTLDVYGTEMAICVIDTTLEKRSITKTN